MNLIFLNLGHQIFLTFNLIGIVRSLSMQHLIENDTDTPNIALRGIRDAFENLYRFIQRCANITFVFHILMEVAFGEPKISNFGHFIFNENIGRLNVSMNHSFFNEFNESITNLCQYLDCLLLTKFFLFHLLFKITLAKLLGYIVIISAF